MIEILLGMSIAVNGFLGYTLLTKPKEEKKDKERKEHVNKVSKYTVKDAYSYVNKKRMGA